MFTISSRPITSRWALTEAEWRRLWA
jgi:hypothetical protein